MDRQLLIQCGNAGPIQRNEDIFIDNDTIGNTSDWAGPFHILSMGRHHRSYLEENFPNVHMTKDLPPLDIYQKLNNKNPSQQVIGNFGESVAAIFARSKLDARLEDIVPLTSRHTVERPDYLMFLKGNNIKNIFSGIIPNDSPFPHLECQNWWPVESKASKQQRGTSQKKEALHQVISYWKNDRKNLQLAVGYGIILTYVYKNPVSVIASIILPKEPGRLYRHLGKKIPVMSAKKLKYYQTAAGFLHECKI